MSKFVDKISIESGKLNCANKSFLQLGKIVQTDLAWYNDGYKIGSVLIKI